MQNLRWIMVATLVAILPIVTIKEYLKKKNYIYLVITMLLYFILMISYINILEKKDVSKIYVILQILQILIIIIYGIFILGEPINRDKSIGILCGLTSIYLLSKQD